VTIFYRDATPADIPAIDALFRGVFSEVFGHLYDPADLAAFFAGFTDAAWADELAQGDLRIRLAEADGALAGFAKVSDPTLPVAPAGPALELRQLYLDPAHRGAGVADALMRWAIAAARDRGAGEVFLSVYVDNHRARRFYERYGFEAVGRYDFMVGDHADEDLIMRLGL
jgi:ribosomal protein S18 acetylase RimI-like enzyme